MAYIFLDESGDLGFDFRKKKTSKFFVITCLFIQNKKPLEKIVKKTHSEFKKKFRRKFGVLHAVKEKPLTRRRFLRRLVKTDIKIMTIYLNKSQVYTKLHDEKQIVYNYVANILLDRVYKRRMIPITGNIELIASRRETNKFLNENFKNYLKNQILNRHKLNLAVEIKTPAQERSLQAVDFVSWSIFRKYEHGDETYYILIKSKIVEENSLF